MFKAPEKYRVEKPPVGYLASTGADGNNGLFVLKREYGGRKRLKHGVRLLCLASDGGGWEHVSVSIMGIDRCPTWDEMCYVKDMFWEQDDMVVQYHPAKEDYINLEGHTLHLWRATEVAIPKPPPIFVGPQFSKK